MLGGGHGVALGRIEHNNAAAGGVGHVDVVHTHAGPANDLEVYGGVQHLGRGLGFAAHYQGVVLGDDADKFLGRQLGDDVHFKMLPQQSYPLLRNRIADQNLHKLCTPTRFTPVIREPE